MEEYIVKEGKRLRLGYTTGSCAAAAAKAATWMLLTGYRKDRISIMTPKGVKLNLDVLDIQLGEQKVSCAIQKDSGDDPDITKGTYIYAEVEFANADITIDGGQGVGRVTRRGLDQPIGAAAINSVPRQMIMENVTEVCNLADYHGGVTITVSVPDGENLTKKTFNPRLGIIGGISILGTTGIVEPMSEKALVDTIRLELRQRKEAGFEYVLLTPGNYGSEFIRTSLKIEPNIVVQTSNFIGDALDICKDMGFRGALLVGHMGKLVKLAGGMLNTHSKYGDCRMEIMASHAAACGLAPSLVKELLGCVTCDEALGILNENRIQNQTLNRIIEKIDFHLTHRCQSMEIGTVLFTKEYGLLAQTENTNALLQQIIGG